MYVQNKYKKHLHSLKCRTSHNILFIYLFFANFLSLIFFLEDNTEKSKKCISRAIRVASEPGLAEDHTIIKLQHPSGDVKTRIFRIGVQITEVYDWAGSISAEPEYFCLFDDSGPLVTTKQLHDQSYEIIMEPCTASEMMSVSGEVNFLGFGEKVDDDYLIVRRSHIVQDLLKVFNESHDVDLTLLRLQNVHGKLEDGCGFGLIRECFSLFWAGFSDCHMDGCLEMVPLTTTGLSKEEWQSLGNLIIFGIREIRYYPLRISRCVLLQWFGCEITTEDLYNSILSYVSPDEKQVHIYVYIP